MGCAAPRQRSLVEPLSEPTPRVVPGVGVQRVRITRVIYFLWEYSRAGVYRSTRHQALRHVSLYYFVFAKGLLRYVPNAHKATTRTEVTKYTASELVISEHHFLAVEYGRSLRRPINFPSRYTREDRVMLYSLGDCGVGSRHIRVMSDSALAPFSPFFSLFSLLFLRFFHSLSLSLSLFLCRLFRLTTFATHWN